MVIQPRRFPKKDGLGFTLLELLLVVALLMGLLAAIVFNFATLKRGADLEEGARQFEALVHFSAAHAANNGRMVQFQFDDSSSSTNFFDMLAEGGFRLRVVWEADPIGQPGVFVDLQEAAQFLEALEERVYFETIELPGRPANHSTNEVVSDEVLIKMPQITFFPDGSSETANVVMSPREPEDLRRAHVHIEGVTGAIRVAFSEPETSGSLESTNALAANPVMEPTRPMETEPAEVSAKNDPFDDEFP